MRPSTFALPTIAYLLYVRRRLRDRHMIRGDILFSSTAAPSASLYRSLPRRQKM